MWSNSKSKRPIPMDLGMLWKPTIALLLQLDFDTFLCEFTRRATERGAKISAKAALNAITLSDIGAWSHL
ncbi:hypothetical protein WG66_011716 [Moniliophthora roreri]|nr:hypothetical protein WG66_011716 [Moniliophthora roreri]